VTATYWTKIGMQALATQLGNSLGGANGGRMPTTPLLGGGQQILQATYDCEVETYHPPGSAEFEELAAGVGTVIQDTGKAAQSSTALTPPDHVEIAHMAFLALVERYGEDSRVKVSGGGTGLVNRDTRGFVAEHIPVRVSVRWTCACGPDS